ncbi:MAG TPA: N-acetyl-gamma-glutamyl-phosphate reductase [Nitratifractor sp.]|nr:N-acetyl-gamma-glutamyl-phosphate reductase [Nitratifractor sp.]
MKTIKVAIVGVSGYTGLELVKLILAHPVFEIAYLATSSGDTTISQLHPSLEQVYEHGVDTTDIEKISKSCELVFLALPHKTSMSVAKELIANGLKVIDLSADYRLELETYEAAYCKHTDKENLQNAAYGLIEYNREDIAKAKVVAGPGCYPTATLLGLLPFIPYLREGTPIFVDAKSGVSGAGKKLTETNSFVTINENIFAYNPLKHRHAPEIAEKIKKVHGKEFQVNFVPHLIPATRGELVSVYAVLKEGIDPLEVLNRAYQDEEFIRVRNKPVDIKSVAGTHFCDIYAQTNGNSLFISSAIDNLLRGASSQALVAANIAMGLEESLGAPKIAYVP